MAAAKEPHLPTNDPTHVEESAFSFHDFRHNELDPGDPMDIDSASESEAIDVSSQKGGGFNPSSLVGKGRLDERAMEDRVRIATAEAKKAKRRLKYAETRLKEAAYDVLQAEERGDPVNHSDLGGSCSPPVVSSSKAARKKCTDPVQRLADRQQKLTRAREEYERYEKEVELATGAERK